MVEKVGFPIEVLVFFSTGVRLKVKKLLKLADFVIYFSMNYSLRLENQKWFLAYLMLNLIYLDFNR